MLQVTAVIELFKRLFVIEPLFNSSQMNRVQKCISLLLLERIRAVYQPSFSLFDINLSLQVDNKS